MKRTGSIVLSVTLLLLTASAQQQKADGSANAPAVGALSPKNEHAPPRTAPKPESLALEAPTITASDTIAVPTEIASVVWGPMRCDAKGNLYLRHYDVDHLLQTPIIKIDGRGQPQARFYSTAAGPDFEAVDFAVRSKGDVYLLAEREREPEMYILSYGKDGSLNSKVKLDANFVPTTMAVFDSGDFLVAGLEAGTREVPAPSLPFTAIFDSGGKLTKRINLEDDEAIRKAVEVGDISIVDPVTRMGNVAIALGKAVAAEDGNVYLMRRKSPAPIIYGIDKTGRVIRRLVIEPGVDGVNPIAFQSSETRLGVLFWSNDRRTGVFRVFSLASGDDMGTYNLDPSLGAGLLCFTDDAITMLGKSSANSVVFRRAQMP